MLVLTCFLFGFQAQSWAGIFGQDSRLEAQLETPHDWAKLARSVPAMIPKEYMQRKGNAWRLTGLSLQRVGYCEDIVFADQRVVANCSASLISEDRVLTAAHCLDSSHRDCEDYAIVFDYALTPDRVDPFLIPDENVYFCDEILYHEFAADFTEDLAIIKLDRKVKGRNPVQLNTRTPRVGDELAMIGHPMGTFQKYVDQAYVSEVEPERLSFKNDLDTFSVNSGGPIFDFRTQEQIGVLVRGSSPNFTRRDNEECSDWGVARENDFSEGNILGELPL